MKRMVIAFDLDGTLAVTKSPISDRIADDLRDLLSVYDVCVISGGEFGQFRVQVIDRLDASEGQLARLHIMPTSGTQYFNYDDPSHDWVLRYSENLAPEQRAAIVEVLTAGAKALGLWETNPYGEIIEDRGSQVTFSALGQDAPAEKKYAWDPDGVKKQKLRDYVAARLPDVEVRVGGTTSVDVTAVGIDKAYGMAKLMSVLGLTKEDILFFGDKLDEGGNDHPVEAMGIDTIAVEGWKETAVAIEAIVGVS
jgi:HAD superfamily hydrolase (TIGR01484 family)